MFFFKDKRTKKRKIGDRGEKVACWFLMKHGFQILERNYLKKYGEIDIVAVKNDILHFIEVKSVSHETSDYRPTENVHFRKLQRLNRVIQTYLEAKKVSYETDWQIDVITVVLRGRFRRSKIDFIENIITG